MTAPASGRATRQYPHRTGQARSALAEGPDPAGATTPGGPRLGPARLAELVASVAAAPARWSSVVRFDPLRRWYRRLELTDDYELWLLSWLPGQETGFHDHGDAIGAFAVADGEVRERSAVTGRPRLTSRVLGAGQVRSFGRQHVHDVANVAARPAVSVHAYSPPLTLMRRYEFTGSGLVLARTDLAGQNW